MISEFFQEILQKELRCTALKELSKINLTQQSKNVSANPQSLNNSILNYQKHQNKGIQTYNDASCDLKAIFLFIQQIIHSQSSRTTPPNINTLTLIPLRLAFSLQIQNQLMIISKLILIAILPIVLCQLGYLKTFEDSVSTIRKSLSQKSLVGSWKLLHDSNFVLNKKITMINQVSSQVMRNNDKISFITSGSIERQAEAFFDSSNPGTEPKSLYLQLYDGKFFNNKTIALEIELKQLKASHRSDGFTNLWNTTRPVIVVCMLIQNKRIIGQISTHAKIQIYSNAKESNLQDANNNYIIKVESDTFSFYADLKYFGNQYDKFINLQAAFSALFLIAIIFLKPKKSVYNISQWLVLQSFAFVLAANWILIGATLQKIDTKLKYVTICCFFNICLAFFFLRNYEEVLKERFQSHYKKIGSALFLLTYFYLCYHYQQSARFWILEQFCLFALQINYSYSKGGRGGLSVTLLANLLIMRISYFYYRFFCPQITRQPTDYKMLGIFITVNLAMLGFIILQRYFGSRFMIPKELIPDYFNYYQTLILGDQVLQDVCPICFQKLKDDSPQDDQNQTIELQETIEAPAKPVQSAEGGLDSNKTVMVTPCNHHYHPKCLLEWMQKRLMCPKCRGDLPPSEGQRDDSYCC